MTLRNTNNKFEGLSVYAAVVATATLYPTVLVSTSIKKEDTCQKIHINNVSYLEKFILMFNESAGRFVILWRIRLYLNQPNNASSEI